MVDDMATKVQALQNKLQKPNLFQKAGQALGKGVDFVTGGAFKSFLRQIQGIGMEEGKTMNAIQLQDNLAKNLKLLDKLNTMKPEDAIKEIQSMSFNFDPSNKPK